MPFLHIAVYPALFLVFSLIIQTFLNKKEFIALFKIYLLAVIFAFAFIIAAVFLEPYFAHSAHILTVLLKSLTIYGILFSLILLISHLIIINSILAKLSLSWTLLSIFSLVNLLGFFTTINIFDVAFHNTPNSPLIYTIQIPVFISLALATGICLLHYDDNYSVIKKILWIAVSFVIVTVVITGYTFLTYYNFIFQYLLIIPAIVLFIIFNIIDFKYFTSRKIS